MKNLLNILKIKKIKFNFHLIAGIVVIVLVGAAYFTYSINTDNVATRKPVNENESINNSSPTISSEIPEHVQDYLKNRYGENTKLEPVTGKIIDDNQLWAINIPLKSIGQEIIITKEPWMLDGDIYDKQLTELETQQKKDFESKEGEARYTILLGRDDLSAELITVLQNSIKQAEQNKIYLEKDKKRLLDTLGLIDERLARYGYGGLFTESNVANIRSNLNQTISVIDDITRMTDLFINIKNGTIRQIRDKNILMTLYSADDEDTVTLVLSWHEEGYQKLHDQGTEIFDKLKAQLPTEG